MTEVLDSYKIRVFKEDEGGKLVDMQDHYPSDFGYLVPSIGDEIPCPKFWSGDAKDYGRNGFLVVNRRIHSHDAGEIILICNYKNATLNDYDIF